MGLLSQTADSWPYEPAWLALSRLGGGGTRPRQGQVRPPQMLRQYGRQPGDVSALHGFRADAAREQWQHGETLGDRLGGAGGLLLELTGLPSVRAFAEAAGRGDMQSAGMEAPGAALTAAGPAGGLLSRAMRAAPRAAAQIPAMDMANVAQSLDNAPRLIDLPVPIELPQQRAGWFLDTPEFRAIQREREANGLLHYNNNPDDWTEWLRGNTGSLASDRARNARFEPVSSRRGILHQLISRQRAIDGSRSSGGGARNSTSMDELIEVGRDPALSKGLPLALNDYLGHFAIGGEAERLPLLISQTPQTRQFTRSRPFVTPRLTPNEDLRWSSNFWGKATGEPPTPRLPVSGMGRASDGSVLPVRTAQPFRQSFVGGSRDLLEAARMRRPQSRPPLAASVGGVPVPDVIRRDMQRLGAAMTDGAPMRANPESYYGTGGRLAAMSRFAAPEMMTPGPRIGGLTARARSGRGPAVTPQFRNRVMAGTAAAAVPVGSATAALVAGPGVKATERENAATARMQRLNEQNRQALERVRRGDPPVNPATGRPLSKPADAPKQQAPSGKPLALRLNAAGLPFDPPTGQFVRRAETLPLPEQRRMETEAERAARQAQEERDGWRLGRSARRAVQYRARW